MERLNRKDLEEAVMEKRKEPDLDFPDSDEDEEDNPFHDYIQIRFSNGTIIDLGSSKYSVVALKFILFDILERQKINFSTDKVKTPNYCR